MELVQSGKLDLDAPIQKYVPSFPDKGAVITVRMVAGHLGGIRHYKGDEFNIQKHYGNVTEGLQIFRRRSSGFAARNEIQLFQLRLQPVERGD